MRFSGVSYAVIHHFFSTSKRWECSFILTILLIFHSPPTQSRKYYPIPMPLSKPGRDFQLISSAVILISVSLAFIYLPHLFSLFFAIAGFYDLSFLRLFPPSLILLHNSVPSLMHFHFLSTLLQNLTLVYTDHTRKIELVRYLMSSYVHGKVLDTLSEHANALASSAMASLEDEADQLSHFPFLPMPCDLVLTVPRHHGWYRKHLSSCEVMNSIAALCPCAARDLQALALQISAVAPCAAFSCTSP